jgi:triosephosphate isomerase (TIM)
MEIKLIVANWKSNKNSAEAVSWLSAFLKPERAAHKQYVICPPYPLLSTLAGLITAAHPANVTLGVQDISPFAAGPYTGEVAGPSLFGLQVAYAIVGHSERRIHLGETSALVAKKVASALHSEITPIVCVDRDQITEQANHLTADERKQVIVAYEPVHAISTFGGQEDPLETTLEAIANIREAFGANTPILYGGSVDKENSLVYLNEPSISGILVGKTSLDPVEFAQL